MEPKISILVPIKERSEWIPWVLWNIDKQSLDEPCEIIIADSTPYALKRWPETLPKKGWPIKVIQTDYDISIGGNRQAAQDAAQGEILIYMDSDDWMHPQLFEEHIKALRQGFWSSMGTMQYMLITKTRMRFEHGEFSNQPTITCFATWADKARATIPWPTHSLSEEMEWMRKLFDRIPMDKRKRVPLKLPCLVLIHSTNEWNTAEYRSYEVAYALTSQKLRKRAPISVPQHDWDELWRHLNRIQAIQDKFITDSPKEKLLETIPTRDLYYYRYGYPPNNITYTLVCTPNIDKPKSINYTGVTT